MTSPSSTRWTRRRALAAIAGAGSALSLAGCFARPVDRPGNPGGEPTESPTASPSADDPTETPTETPDAAGEANSSPTPWAQFGYDAGNTGYAPSAVGPTADAEVEWRFDGETPTMNSSPTVVDGTVYVAGSGDPGHLHAVDAETGEAEWRFEPAGYATSAPASVDGVLYVGTWGKRFYAIDAAEGEELWSVEVGHRFGTSSPVVVDGTAYVGTIGDGPLVVSGPEDEEAFEACALLALDVESGEERWRYDDFGEKDNVESSPAVADGRVFFGGEDAVYALDAESGEVDWTREIATHSQSSPAVADGLVYYGAHVGEEDGPPARVWALDAETGETVWTQGIDDVSLRTSPAVADGTVYVAASSMRTCIGVGGETPNCSGETRGRLYALDASGGDESWRAEIETDTRSSPAVADGVVYVGCRNGLSAVTVDGESAWRVNFESDGDDDPYVKSSPAVSGGRVFVGASDGRVRAITESGDDGSFRVERRDRSPG